MEDAGLFVLVPASEEFRAEYDADEMYTWAWRERAKENPNG